MYALLILTGSIAATPANFGHLWPITSGDPKQIARHEATPWEMKEGDLVFYAAKDRVFRVLYRMAWSREPYHVSIVFRTSSGELRLLEAGPKGHKGVVLLDPAKRFRDHQLQTEDGVLWVRRLRTPLTSEQSARLTQFAEAQNGKDFALVRLGFQVTIFKERTPVVRRLIPDANDDQRNWFCSELVTEAMRSIGVISCNARAGNAIMPHHLWDNDPIDLRCQYENALRWTYGPKPVPPQCSRADAEPIPVSQCEK